MTKTPRRRPPRRRLQRQLRARGPRSRTASCTTCWVSGQRLARPTSRRRITGRPARATPTRTPATPRRRRSSRSWPTPTRCSRIRSLGRSTTARAKTGCCRTAMSRSTQPCFSACCSVPSDLNLGSASCTWQSRWTSSRVPWTRSATACANRRSPRTCSVRARPRRGGSSFGERSVVLASCGTCSHGSSTAATRRASRSRSAATPCCSPRASSVQSCCGRWPTFTKSAPSLC
mmetsp:Transcript_59690/g.182319  ORF Transcript_59690/g.182319 Transcript_59690/m.182319 type:complete len:232 (-) Transcript_59690:188-883(-)